jgi:hypothetical protein
MDWAESISSFISIYNSELGPAHSWAGLFSLNSVVRGPLDYAEISAEFLFRCLNVLGPLDSIKISV